MKRPELTPEQKRRIEENRKKALKIRERLQMNNKDASSHSIPITAIRATQENTNSRSLIPTTSGPINVRLGSSATLVEPTKKTDSRYNSNRQMVNKKDYIEYDFSTLKDSRGGFIGIEDGEPNKGSDERVTGSIGGGSNEGNQTLEEWKEKNQANHIIKDLPPPIDVTKAPKCFECGSLEIDPDLYTNFKGVRVCRRCKKEKLDKYALLTKTECREDYLLTDPELEDRELLSRIEKPNPHGFSRMKLYLRFQVEAYAWKKWGSPEKLDEEWEKRQENKLKRRDKRYQDLLKEMRKKTRAEEYTRRLRDGKSLGERHVHDWSAPISVGTKNNEEEEGHGMKIVKRRCIDCGVETEDIVL
ncbi:uncharacterized protein KQ657_002752 [Scheffersomyces spartinae]|uniref:XPA C-terminal domain-containing protein n=1 Tax=Scheffersomyces spartinae TaxID=45513 RepID=A0A9P8AH54_9ASCO|nr:uncharacterized protein KQ657_002752 [Scheffersomyces spartinae]KAG7191787.1 hypothetical protein KQ657_002752 [Scheffersomyces spartinae]